MYISDLLIQPDERRLRLTAQLGVRQVVVDSQGPGAWETHELAAYRQWIESFDLKLDALVLDTGSVLLDCQTDLDAAHTQRNRIAEKIRRAADAGIACLSYDLQMGGTTRTTPRRGRAGTSNPGFTQAEHAPMRSAATVTAQAGWDAIEFLLEGLLPVADAAGIRLACLPQHPAYPEGGLDGMEHVAGTVDGMRRLLALSPSRNHGLHFCQGTVAAMFKEPAKAVIPVIEEFAATGRIFMVRFGNIRGGYLDFQEVFPDEGDIDMFQALKAYQRGGYAGPLCAGPVPSSDLDDGGERFSSYALGYTRALLQAAGIGPRSARA